MKKTARIYDGNLLDVTLTDFPKLKLLDAKEEGVSVKTNTLEVQGQDGVKIGASNFEPFNIVLRFWFYGVDNKDWRLMETKLRGLLFQRTPFYLVTSDYSARKYACYAESMTNELVNSQEGEITVTFTVYKGYSESLDTTLTVDFLTDNWAYESGLITDRDIKYKHKTKRFEIWNGSYDSIDPLNHRFDIVFKVITKDGFKITNHSTNETFQYNGALTEDNILTLHGVHPILSTDGEDNQRVGANTNWSWLNLQRGMNNIEIEGFGDEDIIIKEISFDFNFIYR